MTDHGGNATPVWLAVAALIFGHTTAGNTTLLAGTSELRGDPKGFCAV